MQNIDRYTKQTTIQEIVKDVLWQSYSKHSQLSYSLLEGEKKIVNEALNKFAQEMGVVETGNKKFELVCFQNYPSYIKFYDLDSNRYIDYYDLEEIDRRYIELAIDKWLDG